MKLSMGSLIGGAVKLAGKTTVIASECLGYALQQVASDKSTKKAIKDATRSFSSTVRSCSNVAGNTLEKGVDGVINFSGEVAGSTVGFAASVCGASKKTQEDIKKCGTLVGKAVAGFMIGDVAATSLVSSLAASGTAGAAATNSGLAALGGGSLAAGGGGMAAGSTVVNMITSTTTLLAAATPVNCVDDVRLLENHSETTADIEAEYTDLTVHENQCANLHFFNVHWKTATLNQVQEMIIAGADVNESFEDGTTPLMGAAGFCSDPAILEALINAGANVKATNIHGWTALDYARHNPHVRGTDIYRRMNDLKFADN